MTLILALDNANGISFNNRRQSRDAVLTQRLVDMQVNIEEYSKSLFPDNYSGDSDFYFIENKIPDLSGAEKLIVYRWNREYPSDKKVDLSAWKKISEMDFVGKSHDRITEETYEKI